MTYIKAIEITPSNTVDDSTEITQIDAIILGSGDTLECQLWGDSGFTSFAGLDTGRIYPFQVRYIKANGTASTTVIGLRAGRMST